MSLFDFFRGVFNIKRREETPQQRAEDQFRNPIWQIDEDDEDISDFSERQPRSRYHFKIFSDPFEMTRFFETQMDDMLKNFFNGFEGFGDSGSSIYRYPEQYSLPFGEQTHTNLRENVLKPEYENPPLNGSPKQDTDLDGKIQSKDLAKLWSEPNKSNFSEPYKPQFSIKTFGKSVSTQIVRRPDGSVEHKQTFKDSDGNEEVIVKRQIGDKMHTITTKISKDGTQVQKEDIVGMNEVEVKNFDEKWNKSTDPESNDFNLPTNDFPWHKFFGPNPKL